MSNLQERKFGAKRLKMKIFKTIDKTSREIYLSKERWKHISKEHPEMVSYLQEFGSILEKPLKISSNEFDEQVKYYYKRLKKLARYIVLIVKYLSSEGYIITAYLVRNIR